jgi:hypothetical protein
MKTNIIFFIYYIKKIQDVIKFNKNLIFTGLSTTIELGLNRYIKINIYKYGTQFLTK